ncbi:VP3 [Mastomys natalensis polyomavirus 3]|nr:VP3 [Mastomys natalensis polyomavirus 3]QFU78317.1 VP3 [Mastomys natalensis polyomavirus 3]
MALVPWQDPNLYDILFPGVNTVAHGLNVVADWGHSLMGSIGRYVWDLVYSTTRPGIEGPGGLSLRQTHNLLDGVSRMLENSRWVITNIQSVAEYVRGARQYVDQVGQAYRGLEDYYRNLGLNPPQRRALFRKIHPTLESSTAVPQRQGTAVPEGVVQDQSGEVIEMYRPPGGAHQRVTPDWMLPLILGLYGDITPTWATYIKEDGPQKKKRRV